MFFLDKALTIQLLLYSVLYQRSVCGNIYVHWVWTLCTSNMWLSENKGLVSDSGSMVRLLTVWGGGGTSGTRFIAREMTG